MKEELARDWMGRQEKGIKKKKEKALPLASSPVRKL